MSTKVLTYQNRYELFRSLSLGLAFISIIPAINFINSAIESIFYHNINLIYIQSYNNIIMLFVKLGIIIFINTERYFGDALIISIIVMQNSHHGAVSGSVACENVE